MRRRKYAPMCLHNPPRRAASAPPPRTSPPQAAAAAGVALVLLVAWAAAPVAAVASYSAIDHDVLHALKTAIFDSDPAWAAESIGWVPDTGSHYCAWEGVKCDEQLKHVVALRVMSLALPAADAATARAPTPNASSPLLPGLARLPRLQLLVLARTGARPWPAIPHEWLEPGAFPALQELSLVGTSLAAPLPDIPPGALPRLTLLHLEFPGLRSTLPRSWGADPAVLPALMILSVTVNLEGGLPPQWPRGFRQLTSLSIEGVPDALAARSPAQPPLTEGTGAQLPAHWPAHWPPKLSLLYLRRLGLTGSIPASWAQAGMPSLVGLNLDINSLSGSLPPTLLSANPRLFFVQLSQNQLTGALPDEWASSQTQLLSLANNSLSGAAFPPAWLAPGALPELEHLDLLGNAGLAGPLPAGLPWRRLSYLFLGGTNVSGSVPSAWCSAPLAQRLERLDLRGTAATPDLPACARKAFTVFYELLGDSVPGQRLVEGKPEQHDWQQREHKQPRGRAASLAALLLPLAALAALAAAGGAARALWRRRLRRLPGSNWEAQQLLAGSPLAPLEHSEAPPPSQEASEGSSSSGSEQARRRRIASLLSPLLQQQHGAAPTIGMFRRADAPAAFAHQLGRASPHKQHGGGASAAGGQPAATRRWGLPTTSIQLQADELEFMTDERGKLVVLGSGGQAVVYLARMQDHNLIAAKVIELQAGVDSRAAWHEAQVLQRCAHARIVPLFGVAIKGPLLVLAMELMEGSLQWAFQDAARRAKLRWEAGGRQVATDVAEALHFLHGHARVLHGDLKPGNVLLTADLRACVSDMGLAQVMAASQGPKALGFCGTHAAPEQLLGQRLTLAADLYSLGVLLVELTTGQPVQRRTSWRLPRAPAECSPAVLALIEQCLSNDSAHRPSAAEALQRLRADGAAADGAA